MARSLLYALATFASRDAVAQVSNAKLAVASGRSVRAVKKHLHEAVKHGWIHVQKSAGITANTYRLNIPPTAADGAPGASVHAVHGAPGSTSGARGAPGDALGAPLAGQGVHPFTGTKTLQVFQGDKSSKGDVRDVVGQPTTERGRGDLSASEQRSLIELERQQNDEASAAEGRARIEQWAKDLHIEREVNESDGEFTRRVLRAKQQTQ